MQEKELLEFKTMLLAREEELRARFAKLDTELDFGDDVDGFDEESDETEEFANQVGLREIFREEITDITHALQKIENHTYGICEVCHESIASDVLRIQPASRLCHACKQEKI